MSLPDPTDISLYRASARAYLRPATPPSGTGVLRAVRAPGPTRDLDANGTVTSARSGLCLDLTGAATADGSPVQLLSCNGRSNQQWMFG
ncbi:RICIN domain-containing protein [Streptomyces camelliae]|uniref:RICIN domain-containing protein n=1 Tax=Streptomyces camelliae TaxID=3004093 RepID=UPI002FD878D0